MGQLRQQRHGRGRRQQRPSEQRYGRGRRRAQGQAHGGTPTRPTRVKRAAWVEEVAMWRPHDKIRYAIQMVWLLSFICSVSDRR